jgi:5-methylcytosine-specific restriction enzyme subunit McrC
MAPNLLGLLAKVLADCTHELLRHQLGRAFLEQHQELRGIRGKIDFSSSLKRMSFEAGRAVCRYPELSIDTLRNRILRSTLARLLRDDRIAYGASLEQAAVLRHELRQAVRLMDGVALITVQSSDFSRLQLGRNDVLYQLPMTICALVHRLEIPSEANGDHTLTALLRDERVFSQVFERFVRNFYRYHLTDCDVRSEELQWHDELGSPFVPVMRTDTTIETKTVPRRRAVIDTKYYPAHLGSRFEGSGKFLSNNLYQIYAYLRTQEDRSDHHRGAEGVLLYPSASGTSFDEAMQVQGHRIRIKTLDLSADWPDIETDLLGLAGTLLN